MAERLEHEGGAATDNLAEYSYHSIHSPPLYAIEGVLPTPPPLTESQERAKAERVARFMRTLSPDISDPSFLKPSRREAAADSMRREETSEQRPVRLDAVDDIVNRSSSSHNRPPPPVDNLEGAEAMNNPAEYSYHSIHSPPLYAIEGVLPTPPPLTESQERAKAERVARFMRTLSPDISDPSFLKPSRRVAAADSSEQRPVRVDAVDDIVNRSTSPYSRSTHPPRVFDPVAPPQFQRPANVSILAREYMPVFDEKAFKLGAPHRYERASSWVELYTRACDLSTALDALEEQVQSNVVTSNETHQEYLRLIQSGLLHYYVQ